MNLLKIVIQKFLSINGYKIIKNTFDPEIIKYDKLNIVRKYVYENCPHQDYKRSYFSHELGAWGPIPSLLYLFSTLSSKDKVKVLDIGCAFGTLLGYCKELGFIPYGIDMVPLQYHMGDKVQNKFKINFSQLTIEKDCLPYGNDEFDIVVMTEFIEHLNFQPLDVMKKLYMVVKKNGYILITTPALGRTQKQEIYNMPFEEIPSYKGEAHTFLDRHMKIYDKDELQRLLKKAGFEVFVGVFMNPITNIEHLYAVAKKN